MQSGISLEISHVIWIKINYEQYDYECFCCWCVCVCSGFPKAETTYKNSKIKKKNLWLIYRHEIVDWCSKTSNSKASGVQCVVFFIRLWLLLVLRIHVCFDLKHLLRTAHTYTSMPTETYGPRSDSTYVDVYDCLFLCSVPSLCSHTFSLGIQRWRWWRRRRQRRLEPKTKC